MDERPRVERFEQLIAWQKARKLATHAYLASERFASRDRSFADQLRRAVVSIAANIAEGFERGSMREFRQFLSISKGSCAEVRTHIYIAADIGYVEQSAADVLLAEAAEVARVIAGLRRSIAPESLRRSYRRQPTRQ